MNIQDSTSTSLRAINSALKKLRSGGVFERDGDNIKLKEPNAGGENFVFGVANEITDSAKATVSGGDQNKISGSSDTSVICGGSQNDISGSSSQSVICGGSNNKLSSSSESFIGGGESHEIISSDNTAVCGGNKNSINDSNESFIGSGSFNITNNSEESFIGSGSSNIITGSSNTVICGGLENDISGNSFQSFIGSGINNSITNNSRNSIIIGGSNNDVSGSVASTIIGGDSNQIIGGDYSIACGQNATVSSSYSFLWTDGTSYDVSGDRTFQVIIGTFGSSARFTDASGVGVSLTPGDTSWNGTSDRNKKENIVEVNYDEILKSVDNIPIYEYNMINGTKRSIGPMAQDWYEQLDKPVLDTEGTSTYTSSKSGEELLSLGTIDLDGVALGAIKGLLKEIKDLKARIEVLENSS